MVKLIKFTALLLAAVFAAEAQAGYYPQTTVLQASGANLHVNVDSAPTTAVTQSGVWSLGISSALPTGSNVIGGVTQSGGPWTFNQTQVGGSSITLGVKTSANSYPIVIASDQSAISTKAPVNANGSFSQASLTTTASTVSMPANAVAVLIQGDSANDDCIRWAVGATATTTSGMVLQAGQDTAEVRVAANLSLVACSTTQKANVQWILSQ